METSYKDIIMPPTTYVYSIANLKTCLEISEVAVLPSG